MSDPQNPTALGGLTCSCGCGSTLVGRWHTSQPISRFTWSTAGRCQSRYSPFQVFTQYGLPSCRDIRIWRDTRAYPRIPMVLVAMTNVYLLLGVLWILNRYTYPYYLYKDEVTAMHWWRPQLVSGVKLVRCRSLYPWNQRETAFLSHWAQTVDFLNNATWWHLYKAGKYSWQAQAFMGLWNWLCVRWAGWTCSRQLSPDEDEFLERFIKSKYRSTGFSTVNRGGRCSLKSQSNFSWCCPTTAKRHLYNIEDSIIRLFCRIDDRIKNCRSIPKQTITQRNRALVFCLPPEELRLHLLLMIIMTGVVCFPIAEKKFLFRLLDMVTNCVVLWTNPGRFWFWNCALPTSMTTFLTNSACSNPQLRNHQIKTQNE